MGNLHIDDGYPESGEYCNNYIYFDGQNIDCIKKIIHNLDKIKRKESTNKITFSSKDNNPEISNHETNNPEFHKKDYCLELA
jgi:hypothetical protein